MTRRLMTGLLGESAVYGIGGVANQSLNILLVPIYARQLEASGYGVVAVISATLSLAGMIATLALPQAFFRSFLQESSDARGKRHVLAVTATLRLVASFGFVALFTLASVPITLLVFGGSLAELPLIALIGPIVFFDSLNSIPLAFLRAQRRPAPYVTITFTRAILGSILIIFFVVVLDLGPLGVVLGSTGSALVSASMGVAAVLRAERFRFVWDSALVRHMLTFSLPLVPASIAAWGLNLSDRYVIRAFDGFSAAGVYSSGYQAGLVVTAIAVAPFTLAWGAAYWEISRGPDAERIIGRVLTAFVIVATGIALGLSAIGSDAIRILLGHQFEGARFVVPFSAFSSVVYGAYAILATGLNIRSQTRWLPLTMAAAAIGNVALNLLLVPRMGYIGAAVASLISYSQLALSSGWIGQRYYRVPWDVPRVLATLLIGGGLSALALLGPDNVWWRLGCIAVYPIAVVALRIIRPAEIASLAAVLRRRRA